MFPKVQYYFAKTIQSSSYDISEYNLPLTKRPHLAKHLMGSWGVDIDTYINTIS